MFEFDSMVARQRKWMLYFLALFVLGAGFLPYTRVFNGLVLGEQLVSTTCGCCSKRPGRLEMLLRQQENHDLA